MRCCIGIAIAGGPSRQLRRPVVGVNGDGWSRPPGLFAIRHRIVGLRNPIARLQESVIENQRRARTGVGDGIQPDADHRDSRQHHARFEPLEAQRKPSTAPRRCTPAPAPRAISGATAGCMASVGHHPCICSASAASRRANFCQRQVSLGTTSRRQNPYTKVALPPAKLVGTAHDAVVPSSARSATGPSHRCSFCVRVLRFLSR